MIELRAGSATDVGKVRSKNQDRLVVADPLFAVADGMGGAAAGEVASQTAVSALEDVFSRIDTPTADDLLDAAQSANRAVWDQAEANPDYRGMGTTLVALALVDDGSLAIVNVGDSRLYAFHDGELRQVTDDHNLVAELVQQGRLSKEEAEFHPRRNIMTRALGVEPVVPVDLFLEPAEPGDRYLLCSDGLPREVADDQIGSVLRRLEDPAEAARELVDEAIRRGGNDNITVVVVDVVDGNGGSPAIAPGREDGTEPPAPVAPAGQPPEPRRRIRLPRFRAEKPPGPRPHSRILTFRVVAFMVALLVVLGLGAFGVGWYGRSGYFVGLKGSNLIVFKGRPGGVLWIKPTVADATGVTTDQVLPRHLPALQSGVEESSLGSAVKYVDSLVSEKSLADSAALPPSSPGTAGTTSPPTT